MHAAERTRWVVEQARALGFDVCGVAGVEQWDELERLPEWLAWGYAGEMKYLSDSRRRSPARVLEGARSLIVCALNYNSPFPYSTEFPTSAPLESNQTANRPRGWLSRYAWGDDYHEVVLGKLNELVAAMRRQIGDTFEARAYVDTGPVVERVAAKYAGLGWLAKNTCLINEKLGSWLFLGVVVTTLELKPSLGAAQAPPPDLCGNCRLCLEACPTGAIVEPYLLDARRCISYLTIELRGSIPEKFREAMGRHVFGCDICQDVCPWNREAPVSSAPAFLPRRLSSSPGSSGGQVRTPCHSERSEESQPNKQQLTQPVEGSRGMDARGTSLFAPELEWVASLTEEEFREVFRGSAVKRAKWRGLVRNACVALGNSGLRRGTATHARIVAQLERLAGAEDAVIAEHARWALSRLLA